MTLDNARHYLAQAQSINEVDGMGGHALFIMGCAINNIIEYLSANQAESSAPQLADGMQMVQSTYETLTPTSELLNKAARIINDLMIGRGVDRRNGFQWQAFVRELYDRAAAFKKCEDEGR